MDQQTTDMVYAKNSGVRKAAILILALGDELAREVFKRLGEDEIRHLGHAATQLDDVTPAEVIEVLHEFQEVFGGGHVPKKGAGSVFQVMVERALGEDRAKLLPSPKASDDPFDFLTDLDPRAVSTVLTEEHPQTVAIVLANAEPALSAELLEQFDNEQAAQIVFRMAQLGSISDDVLRDIGQTLREELEKMSAFDAPAEKLDGESRAVEILKRMPQEFTDELVDAIADTDFNYAQALRGKLFIFEDLVALDPRTMQRLLREIDTKTLSVALKGATEEVQNAFFAAMSTRASEMLRDDMDASGPMRLTDVEHAQRNILDVAMRLESEGVIVLPRGGADGLV